MGLLMVFICSLDTLGNFGQLCTVFSMSDSIPSHHLANDLIFFARMSFIQLVQYASLTSPGYYNTRSPQ